MGETIATNKNAFRDYAFTQTWECGIELKGCEVKSLRAGHVSFRDSFAQVDNGRVLLYSLRIEPYQPASYMNADPDRIRALLVTKAEIKKMDAVTREKGLSLIPTKMYFNQRGYAKVQLALGRGKKLYDKREDIKKRDVERSLRRVMRHHTR
jgi:SsrA-binding protein